MLLLCTAIAFRSPLLKRLDQIFRQVTDNELRHRSPLRRRIPQFYRFGCPIASIDSNRLMHSCLRPRYAFATRLARATRLRGNGIAENWRRPILARKSRGRLLERSDANADARANRLTGGDGTAYEESTDFLESGINTGLPPVSLTKPDLIVRHFRMPRD